jgi:WD40 repeat protein
MCSATALSAAAPSDPGADARGCLAAAEAACGTGFLCDEAAESCRVDCDAPDPDGDGHDAIACGGDDCDDSDALRFPGNLETCLDTAGGSHDEDCNPNTFGDLDMDGDGEVASTCCNGANCGSDCDDSNVARRSLQVEFCDAVDNDCDGNVDEDTQAVTWYPDADGDAFGALAGSTLSCSPIANHSLIGTDCDDTDAARHPAQNETCDFIDNNCNGMTDEQVACDGTTVVGSAGGMLTSTASSGSAIRVVIPPSALATPTTLAVGEIHPRNLTPLPPLQTFLSLPVALSPPEVTFALPVTVSLPAAGPNVEVIALSNPDDPTWELVEWTYANGYVTFTTIAGGIFAVATHTCEEGVWDHDQMISTACEPWSDCNAGSYVSVAGTPTTDRQCAACGVGTYSDAPNEAACTPCTDGFYNTATGATSAAACVPWAECATGRYVTVAGTTSSNRQCGNCPSQHYSDTPNAPACTPWTVCMGSSEIIGGSSQVDRTCSVWTRQFGTAGMERGTGIAVFSDGESAIAGFTTGDLEGSSTGEQDAFVRRYDAAGGILWARQFGTSVLDIALAVAAAPDGSVVVAGETSGALEGSSAGGTDGFVRKYDVAGTVVWTRQLGTSATDRVNAVAVQSDGSVFVAGETLGALTGVNAGDKDAFVRKYDAAGTIVWTRQFGTSNDDVILGIAAGPDGTVAVTGGTDGALTVEHVGDEDAFVRMYDADGNALWTREYGTGGTRLDRAESVAIGSDGQVVITGWSFLGGSGNGFVRQYDAVGVFAWGQMIAIGVGTAYPQGVAVASDGSVVVTGTQGNFPFVAKYDGSGSQQRAFYYNSQIAFSESVVVGADGSVLVGGYTNWSVLGTNAGSDDAYVVNLGPL